MFHNEFVLKHGIFVMSKIYTIYDAYYHSYKSDVKPFQETIPKYFIHFCVNSLTFLSNKILKINFSMLK